MTNTDKLETLVKGIYKDDLTKDSLDQLIYMAAVLLDGLKDVRARYDEQ